LIVYPDVLFNFQLKVEFSNAFFFAKQEEIAMAVARARERARASVASECI